MFMHRNACAGIELVTICAEGECSDYCAKSVINTFIMSDLFKKITVLYHSKLTAAYYR
jgi:hypothetical protein